MWIVAHIQKTTNKKKELKTITGGTNVGKIVLGGFVIPK